MFRRENSSRRERASRRISPGTANPPRRARSRGYDARPRPLKRVPSELKPPPIPPLSGESSTEKDRCRSKHNTETAETARRSATKPQGTRLPTPEQVRAAREVALKNLGADGSAGFGGRGRLDQANPLAY